MGVTEKSLLVALAGIAAVAVPAQADGYKVAYASPIASQPGQATAIRIMEKMAPELGWEFRMLDANLSPDRQVSNIDTLVTLRQDAIASWSLDPNSVTAAYLRANESGIPIIGVNSEGPGITLTVWWETNICVDGGTYDRQVAWIRERRPDARVIVMGGPPAPSIQQNSNCFDEAARKAGLEVVARVDNTKDSTANASAMTSDLLIRHPQADVFWSYNDSSAIGISSAVIAAGKGIYAADGSDGIMVFGMNGDDEAIVALQQGRITGSWDPDVYAMAAGILRGFDRALKNPGAEHEDIIVKSVFLTYENIGSYVPTLERGYTIETVPLVE